MNLIHTLSQLITLIQSAVTSFRVQDFFHAQQSMAQITSALSLLLAPAAKEGEPLSADHITDITQCLYDIMQAQQAEDTVLLADLLELQLFPAVDSALQELVFESGYEIAPEYLQRNLDLLQDKALAATIQSHAKTISSQSAYVVEATNLGCCTIKYQDNGSSFYYHSNANPVAEGKQFAAYYAVPDTLSYAIVGFGFGYHAAALLAYDLRYTVTVFEQNLDVLTLAFLYCDLSTLLSNPRFCLRYCQLSELSGALQQQKQTALLIHYPSMKALPDGAVKQAFQNYFLVTSSIYSRKKLLDENFYYNLKQKDASIDVLKNHFYQKSVLYAGGGPSLEDHIRFLQREQSKPGRLLLCASTVYRKLLEYGITPDFVVMIDPQPEIQAHIAGIPANSCSLLYLSTASMSAVRAFKGTRYIAFQNGYEPAEQYAASEHHSLLDTGGSVSTTVLDLILQFGAKELITMGLDLAHTDQKDHSFSTDHSLSGSAHIPVRSVAGGTVLTTSVLNSYRLWIEKRLRSATSVRLINLSRGAYIEGMENMRDETGL